MKTKDVIGIALDLNLEPVSGIRIDELIRRSLRKFYNELKQDFIFCLHNPKSDLHDFESNEINENYFPAELNDFSLPCPFEFQTALNDLLSRVTNDCDVPVLVIITNRYFEEQKYYYELMLRNNLKRDLNCNVILVGVGDNYDKDSFSSLSNFSSLCDFVHLELNELEELNNVLLFSLKGGEDQIALEIAAKVLDAARRRQFRLNQGNGGFNISGESNVSLDEGGFEEKTLQAFAPQPIQRFKVLPAENVASLKGCAEVKAVHMGAVAKKSVKSIKKPTKKPTKKTTNKKSK